jgi:hypothetical protein
MLLCEFKGEPGKFKVQRHQYRIIDSKVPGDTAEEKTGIG